MIGRGLVPYIFVLAACSRDVPSSVSSSPPGTDSASSVTSGILQSEEVFAVGGDVRAPVLIESVEPKYPEQFSKGPRQAGLILLEAVVDRTGAVRDVAVKQGANDPASPYAVEAVKKWRFSPATRNGKPVAVRYQMTVNIQYR